MADRSPASPRYGRRRSRHSRKVSASEVSVKATCQTKRSAALVGLAFDAEDGHKRLTRGTNFVLFGGSADTHSVMQETAIKVNERLEKRGKRLEDVSLNELRDLFSEL